MVGGSSGSNYMFYVRGNKEDYNKWEELGNEGWNYESVLPYFIKSERFDDETNSSSEYHGTDGYLGVSKPDWGDEIEEYFTAFEQNGRKRILDYNGAEQVGYAFPTFTIDDKVRQSTGYAFLRPIKDRENLFLSRNAFVRKILFNDNNEATAVEVMQDDEIQIIKARKEIILSAGAINSPKLLLLSGVGPEDDLAALDIPVVSHSANVGRNLQDHATVPIAFTEDKSILTVVENLEVITNLDQLPVPCLMGFTALNSSQTVPDYQTIVAAVPVGSVLPTILCNFVFGLNDDICNTIAKASLSKGILLSLVVLLYPESRGTVVLQSKDPEDDPIIDLGYYSEINDLENHARFIQDYITVLDTDQMKESGATLLNLNVEQCNDIEFNTTEYWECYSKNIVTPLWHPVGTCRMGAEGTGVIDDRFNVYGVKNLRVIDASSMPRIVGGNTNAPCIMLGEKGADIIKADYGFE